MYDARLALLPGTVRPQLALLDGGLRPVLDNTLGVGQQPVSGKW